MAKKLISFAVLILLLSTGLKAQKWSFAGGFVYEFITLKDKNPIIGEPTSQTMGPFYGLSLGGQYTVLHKNDIVSLNIDPGVRLGFNYFSYNNITGAWILGQIPLNIMARVGAGATPFNDQKVGLGLGGGGNFTYIHATQFNPTLRKAFVTPNAVVELNINGRGSMYHIRFHWSLLDAPLDLNGKETHFGNFGLEIISSF